MRRKNLIWIASFGITAIFLWLTTSHLIEVYSSYNPDETQLLDPAAVKRYLTDYCHDMANCKDGTKYFIPTGVFIQALSWLTPNSFLISGYIWQKYPNNFDESIGKGIILPEAIELRTEVAYREQTGDSELIGWHFEGKFTQSFDYKKYPLDNKTILMRLWHKDFTQRLILVPDLAGYYSTKASEKF